MDTKWIFSSTFLPYTGEPIEFLLQDREQPIHGTFADGVFHSRWADYGADRIASWRETDGDPSAERLPVQSAGRRTFMSTLKQLTRILSRGRKVAPIDHSRRHSRKAVVTAISMPALVIPTQCLHSNQISS